MKHLFSSITLCALLATGALVTSGCDRAGNSLATKLNLDNYGKVTTGMSKSQVRDILGPPTSEESKDVVVYKRTTWTYSEGDKFVKLTFKNDELDSKDSNLAK